MKGDMNIIFLEEQNKEYFNHKFYPLGTTFTFILNQLSSLAYNKNFKLESYKNINLLRIFFNNIKQLSDEKLKLINQKNYIQIDNTNLNEELTDYNIEIEGISVSDKEFKELTLLILYIDEFLGIILKDKELMNIESFLYFFSTMKNYAIPNCKIIDKHNDDDFMKYQKEIFSNNKIFDKDIIESNYNNIVQSDIDTLKSLIKYNHLMYEYSCNNFVDVLLASLKYIIEKKVNLKNCELCNNFFIATHANKRFCDNIRPQYINETKKNYMAKRYTCSEYNQKYLSYQNLSEERQAKRRVKANINKRIKAGTETNDYLEDWEKRVANKKRDIEYGYISIKDFIEWIKNKSDTHGRRQKNGSTRNNKK